MSRWLTSILWLLLAMPLFGSGKKWTDAENLGFAGPVKSVTTMRQTYMKQPAQPDGHAIIYPLFCEECEFGRNGNEVSSKFWRGPAANNL
jgi:hypothetical protein